jgi:GDP-L-fucose synthase
MKVFIAGSEGMVGAALLRLAPKDVELLTATKDELDLSKPEAVLNFLSQHRPHSIVLAAAKVGGIGTNSINHKSFLLANLNIQNSVVEAASNLKISNFLFLGSSCIYPKLAPQPIREDSLLTGPLEATNEGYALAKISGIRLCKAVHDQDGLNYFSLMPTNLYGPNDNYNKFASHVPAALMRKFHEAKVNHESEVVVWGTGTPRREFMHVDDMARACWYMLDQDVGGELINIGTGEDVTIAEFAELMAKVVGFEGEIVFDNSMPDGTPRKLLDVNKAHSYGWKHRIELEDGLRQTYAWFVDALAKGEVRGY